MTNIRKRYPLLAVLCFGLASNFLVAQTDEQIERWEEILLFGIDSEVSATLDEAKEELYLQLVDEAEQLLDSLNPQVVQSAFGYLREANPSSLEERSRDAIANYDIENGLVLRDSIQFFLDFREFTYDFDLDLARELLFAPVVSNDVKIRLLELWTTEVPLEGVGDLLFELYQDDETEQVFTRPLIAGLSRVKHEEAYEEFVDMLFDTSSATDDRLAAIEFMGNFENPEFKNQLSELLVDDNTLVRGAAIKALASIEKEDRKPLLRQALRDNNWRNRVSALDVLEEEWDADFSRAVQFMAHRDPEAPVRNRAFRSLSKSGEIDAIDWLIEQLADSDTSQSVKTLLVELLTPLRTQEVYETLLDQLQENQDSTNPYLVHGFGKALLAHREFVGSASIVEYFLGIDNPELRIYGLRLLDRWSLSDGYEEQLREIYNDSSAPSYIKTWVEQLIDVEGEDQENQDVSDES